MEIEKILMKIIKELSKNISSTYLNVTPFFIDGFFIFFFKIKLFKNISGSLNPKYDLIDVVPENLGLNSKGIGPFFPILS